MVTLFYPHSHYLHICITEPLRSKGWPHPSRVLIRALKCLRGFSHSSGFYGEGKAQSHNHKKIVSSHSFPCRFLPTSLSCFAKVIDLAKGSQQLFSPHPHVFSPMISLISMLYPLHAKVDPTPISRVQSLKVATLWPCLFWTMSVSRIESVSSFPGRGLVFSSVFYTEKQHGGVAASSSSSSFLFPFLSFLSLLPDGSSSISSPDTHFDHFRGFLNNLFQE